MIVGTEAETDLQDRDGPPTRRPHRSRHMQLRPSQPMQLRPSQPTRRRTSQPTGPHQASSWSSTRRRRAALPRRQQEAVHRGRWRSASRSKTPPRPSQLHTCEALHVLCVPLPQRGQLLEDLPGTAATQPVGSPGPRTSTPYWLALGICVSLDT